MGFFFRHRPSGSPHYSWVVARIDENDGRDLQELVDSLRTLLGTGHKGLFGMAPGSFVLTDSEKDELVRRITARVRAGRDALERRGDFGALLDLAKVADLCNMPELRVERRFPLRCDPLGQLDGLAAEWLAVVERLRRAREHATPLHWERAAARLADDEAPTEVTFGEPDDTALYELALRHELTTPRRTFSRELAAVWSVANGIRIDDLGWYLSPVTQWSWEEEGLQIGGGQSIQGRLCLTPDGAQNLADAPVVDLDDDGEIIQTYPSLLTLLDLLLP